MADEAKNPKVGDIINFVRRIPRRDKSIDLISAQGTVRATRTVRQALVHVKGSPRSEWVDLEEISRDPPKG